MTDQILFVTKVENVKDKRETPYKKITVKTNEVQLVYHPGLKKEIPVRGKELERSFNAYPNNYLNKADQYHDVTVGEYIFGDIVTRAVETYTVPAQDGTTREVNSYTCIVFGHTTASDWEQTIHAEFARRGHKIVNPAQVVVTAKAPQSVQEMVAAAINEADEF